MTSMAWGFMLTVWATIFITEGIAMRRILKIHSNGSLCNLSIYDFRRNNFKTNT